MFGMGTGGTSLPSSPLWLYLQGLALAHILGVFVLIYPLYQGFIRTFFFNLRFGKINNYIANFFFAKSFTSASLSFRARKNRRSYKSKRFRILKLFSHFIEIKPSTY